MIKSSRAAFIATSSAIIWAALPLSAAAQNAAPTCGTPSFANRAGLNPVAGSNLMTVPLTINGVPKQFLLDVGTSPDEISEAAASELHLTRADRHTTDPTDRDLGKAEPYDGRLTASGFRHYDLDVNFGAKRLAFLAATGCADPNQIVYWPHSVVAVIPMTSAFGKISVPVSIDGHVLDAVIDTGSDRTVMRRAIAERLFGLKADTPEMTAEADLHDGAGARVYRHTFPKIAFEGVAVGNLPVLIEANSMIRKARKASVTGSRLQAADDPGDPIPDLALGMDVLRQLHIYAAFGMNKLYVTPAG